MKKIFAVLFSVLLLSHSANEQMLQAIVSNRSDAYSATLPVYSQAVINTWELNTGGTCPGGGTTCSVTFTAAASDLFLINCGAVYPVVALNNLNASTSPSVTVHNGTFIESGTGAGTNSLQLNWAIAAGAGSYTVTCTANTAISYPVTIVYDYSGGSGATLNTSATSTTATGLAIKVSPFTTTGPAIVLYCMAVGGSTTPSLGTIGGGPAAHLTVETSGFSACEDRSVTSAISAGSAILNVSPTQTSGAAYVLAVQ